MIDNGEQKQNIGSRGIANQKTTGEQCLEKGSEHMMVQCCVIITGRLHKEKRGSLSSLYVGGDECICRSKVIN